MSNFAARKIHEPTKGMKNFGFVYYQRQIELLDSIKSGDIKSDYGRRDDGTIVTTTQERCFIPYVFCQFKSMIWVSISIDDLTLLTNDNIINNEPVRDCINNKKTKN